MKSKPELGEESRAARPGGEQPITTINSASPGEVPQALKELVERFRVCWEVLPDYYYVKKEKRQIGFTLVLTGTHEPAMEHPLPGCQHCQKVWLALQTITNWILPKERRDSAYDIVPFDQAIHYDPVRKFRPEVSLKICICHRSGFDRPLDACEVRCLGEMEQRLRELGACKGRWEAQRTNQG